MKRITTFEEACQVKNMDPKTLQFVAPHSFAHMKAVLAFAQLVIIAEVLNEGWVPDWNNDDEYKYYPWFDLEKTDENPSGFSLDSVRCYYSDSSVPSRLCFKNRELAEYAVRTFEQLYKDYFLIE
jgi:hypothetical protein